MSSELEEKEFRFSFYDPERQRETTICIERFVTRKGLIGDKIAYRFGFVFGDGGVGEHKGYLVGKSLPDVTTRALKAFSKIFEDPLLDEQSLMLALQRR